MNTYCYIMSAVNEEVEEEAFDEFAQNTVIVMRQTVSDEIHNSR